MKKKAFAQDGTWQPAVTPRLVGHGTLEFLSRRMGEIFIQHDVEPT